MPDYVKIGRDIIVGTGFNAKHWSGPVVFGRDGVYICPNASHSAVVAGFDSGGAALGMLFGAVGGLIAGLASKGSQAQTTWKDRIVDLPDLPADILSSPDWPVRKKKRPVIHLQRDQIEKIARVGSRLQILACGETFKLGLNLFGRGKVVATIRELGWPV
jgi:hypothetical protein